MTQTAILTYDLRVLCMQKGQLVACSLNILPDLSHVVSLQKYSEGWNLASFTSERWWYDIHSRRFDRYTPEANIGVEGNKSNNSICRFTGIDGYFQVKSSGDIEPCRGIEHRRECMFRLIDLSDLRALWTIMKERWILGGSSKIVSIASSDNTIWDVYFGSLVIDFEDFMKSVRQKHQLSQRELFLTARNNVYRAIPYRPVVFYSITMVEKLSELSLSLKSLVDRGEYQGEICIVTNLPTVQVEAFIPRVLRNNYHIIKAYRHSKRDDCCKMIAVLGSGKLDRFSPVLCLDSSVLITQKIEPLLVRLAQSKGITAPVKKTFQENEEFNDPCYGHFLCDKDEHKKSIHYGFSPSVIALSSTQDQKHFLLEALRCSAVYLRDQRLPLYDHHEIGVLHYTAAMMDFFDPTVFKAEDCNPFDQATPGVVGGTLLCCEDWPPIHRTMLMQFHLESLPRAIS